MKKPVVYDGQVVYSLSALREFYKLFAKNHSGSFEFLAPKVVSALISDYVLTNFVVSHRGETIEVSVVRQLVNCLQELHAEDLAKRGGQHARPDSGAGRND